MTALIDDPSLTTQLVDAASATFNISVWVPILALILTAIGLGYSIWRWRTWQAEKKRLAGILCAAQLEVIAQRCLAVAHDYGTYGSPKHYSVVEGLDTNEAMVKNPDIPKFATVEHVATLGTVNLNRLLSLGPAMGSINAYIVQLREFDHPDFMQTFEHRRILMAGFGEYCARLAIDIRKFVGAPSISQAGPVAQRNLKAQFADLIGEFQVAVEKGGFASPGKGPKDVFEATATLKTTYEAVFLPDGESYWPAADHIIECNRLAHSSTSA